MRVCDSVWGVCVCGVRVAVRVAVCVACVRQCSAHHTQGSQSCHHTCWCAVCRVWLVVGLLCVVW